MSSFHSLEVGEVQLDGCRIGQITVKSNHLQGRGDITVYLPEIRDPESPLPICYLLHGIYGSHWAWTTFGGAHRTAREMIQSGVIPPMVLVMPSDGLWGDGTGYVPHSQANYRDWIIEDTFNAVVEAWPEINFSGPRFVSGLSMGGLGALLLGAQFPQVFRGISAHSSITHLHQLVGHIESRFPWDLEVPDEETTPIHWIEKHRDFLPGIRFDCGVDDPLISANRQLHQRLKQLRIPHHYEEFEGAHNWSYWRLHLRDSLRYFGTLMSQ